MMDALFFSVTFWLATLAICAVYALPLMKIMRQLGRSQKWTAIFALPLLLPFLSDFLATFGVMPMLLGWYKLFVVPTSLAILAIVLWIFALPYFRMRRENYG